MGPLLLRVRKCGIVLYTTLPPAVSSVLLNYLTVSNRVAKYC